MARLPAGHVEDAVLLVAGGHHHALGDAERGAGDARHPLVAGLLDLRHHQPVADAGQDRGHRVLHAERVVGAPGRGGEVGVPQRDRIGGVEEEGVPVGVAYGEEVRRALGDERPDGRLVASG